MSIGHRPHNHVCGHGNTGDVTHQQGSEECPSFTVQARGPVEHNDPVELPPLHDFSD